MKSISVVKRSRRKPTRKTTCRKERRLNIDVQLPGDYPWRLLNWLASDLRHLLDDSESRTLNHLIRRRDIAGLMELSEAWGLQSISSVGRPLAKARAIYQLSALLKKFRFETDRDVRVATAERKFKEAEEHCSHYNHGGYRQLFLTEDGVELKPVFRHAARFLRRLLGNELPGGKVMTEWSRHGPGANLDTKDGKVSTYDKYRSWPYSCTVDAYRYARYLIQSDQRWIGALEDSYRQRRGIPRHAILDQKRFWKDVIKIVDGNRITFVPKNAKTERSIAIEPALNLCLQLGADGYIRRRLKRWGIDIDDQSKNQELARRGSLNDGDEGLVTLDLSAASDSISLKLCEVLLPSDWFRYLCDLRSPSGVLGKESIHYEKISSMGNGVTFALETAIFASVIYGVMVDVDGRYDQTKCAVFGDDLIVPKRLAGKVVRYLALAGFAVNSDKSFFSGRARESCGSDWLDGKPVRPVFISETPTTVMGLLTDYNRLRRLLSLRWGIGDECKLLSKMRNWIPKRYENLVGPASNEDFDSYRHVDEALKGTYKYCLWKYRRLVVRPREVKGRSFLFRKLMHSLRGADATLTLLETLSLKARCDQWSVPQWRGARLTGKGSRFTVTQRNKVTVSYAYSVADIWRSTYTEVVGLRARSFG